ncbi:MAG: hypothetical protein K1Y36_04850 [Blastocatellia bacterium]|nr:hypothetical protein [Blastocatellia bacterium]
MRFVQQQDGFVPVITDTPDLPSIDWSVLGQEAPILLDTPVNELPPADVVIITWALSEWAAMEQVFCNSQNTMPYSDQNNSSWPGWYPYTKYMLPYCRPDDPWTCWCLTRLVEIQGKRVLLIKSNTHLVWPGEIYLEGFIGLVVTLVQPKLLISIGTSGGTQVTAHTGTTYIVNGGTLYNAAEPQPDWPTYRNAWEPNTSVLWSPGFPGLLFPVPTTESDLQSLCQQFNQYYGTSYTLDQLNPGNLDMADPLPLIENLTSVGMSLLTTSTFIVGNNAGNFASFACVEMSDAIVGKICNKVNVPFGFIRNLSNPAQNAQLPEDVQSNWGNTLYESYGFYTSFNGALAAWAVTTAQLAGEG